MAIDIDTLATKVRKLRDHFHTRDARWADLLAIRQGDIQQVFPGMFPDEFPKPITSLTLQHVTYQKLSHHFQHFLV